MQVAGNQPSVPAGSKGRASRSARDAVVLRAARVMGVGFSVAVLLLTAQTIGLQRAGARVINHSAATKFPVDHFACYPSQLTGGHKPKVSLKNQFGSASAVPATQFKLCAPASKNGSTILNRKAHLTCYTLTSYHSPTNNRVVSVTNQFGTLKMTVVLNPPQSLCLPSSKSVPGVIPGAVPTTLDHYLCYAVKPSGTFQPKTVKVSDQFGTSSDTVIAPRSLCVPTAKNGSRLTQPTVHLLCYLVKSTAKGHSAAAKNQFGLLNGGVGARDRLCVPSSKKVVS